MESASGNAVRHLDSLQQQALSSELSEKWPPWPQVLEEKLTETVWFYWYYVF